MHVYCTVLMSWTWSSVKPMQCSLADTLPLQFLSELSEFCEKNVTLIATVGVVGKHLEQKNKASKVKIEAKLSATLIPNCLEDMTMPPKALD